MKTEIDIAIMELVRTKRKEAKMSQLDLGLAMGHSSGSLIGAIESLNYPDAYNIGHLNQIAIILKCTLHELIPMYPK